MTPWVSLKCLVQKILVGLWYMLNRTLKTNLETRSPLKTKLEFRGPHFLCHVIWAAFATPNVRKFARSEDSGRAYMCTRECLRSEWPSRILTRNISVLPSASDMNMLLLVLRVEVRPEYPTWFRFYYVCIGATRDPVCLRLRGV